MLTALAEAAADAVPIKLLTPALFSSWVEQQPPLVWTWLRSIAYAGDAGTTALIPSATGSVSAVVHSISAEDKVWALAPLHDRLPEGRYALEKGGAAPTNPAALERLAIGWCLGSYRFDRYKTAKPPAAMLVRPEGVDRTRVSAVAEGIALARDLINTPAEEMGPAELEDVVRTMAASVGASVTSIVGDALLEQNYPLIHAVGRASVREPRLIDLRWGDPATRKLTLVGKGVCFDSGGLDLKPSSAMKLMKKDMGGAATLIGLASTIMRLHLPVYLRLLVPAVENFISANSFRPMDVFRSRRGLTVEIGNTDAEGRLVLCDALTEAMTERPELVIDVATLTGAARTALGPDLPALFSNDDAVASELVAIGCAEDDPLWQLPLWQPYRKMLDSKIADINNASDSGFAGAITAALYLREFVEPSVPWLHIDSYAWNGSNRPGRPEGGEALAFRALLRLIEQRFS